jgi:YidC/Oxa1 family membrane protein insertase
LDLHGSDEGDIVFTADGPDGARLEKRYRFRGAGYAFGVVTAVRDRLPSVGLVLTPLPPEGTSASAELGVALANRKLASHPFKEIAKAPVSVDAATWAGFAEQYFLVAALPEAGTASALFTTAEGVPIVRVDAPVSQQTASFLLYMGPKDPDILAQSGHDLDRAVDFGLFFFVAIPLLKLLRLIHRFTGNYGVAIIVLTAIAKVVTAPLTQTTFRNMREMQKIQPQMAKLRERYKDDQVALQKEMMELYKRHRVNPFSGCLPMLLQFPIFIGLYNALSHAIELRHAPFAFWIHDLSAPDWATIGGISIPVLTLLMGASMFLQQWLTPAQGDPTQQRMMMFTPVIFTFMFINFPAGLVLYWLVNNVLTIGQQYYMMRSAT